MNLAGLRTPTPAPEILARLVARESGCEHVSSALCEKSQHGVEKNSEAAAANFHVAPAAHEPTEPAALRMNPRSRDLARQFIGGGLLPTSAASDAEHIAVAATNAVRILLTWNCKHLANPSIRDALILACEKNRVRCPEICTPEQLMRTYAYERPAS